MKPRCRPIRDDSVQLTIEAGDTSHQTMDMLLANKRASDRKAWLAMKGDLVEV